MTNNHWDAVIIGGGLAGLVSAAVLGKAGMKTLLLEKAKSAGGRAKTDIVSGQYFNIGPHALYKNGKAVPILKELGVEINGSAPKIGGLLMDGPESFTAPFSPTGVLQSKLLNWKEKIEWIGILRRIQKLKPGQFSSLTFQQFVDETTQTPKIQKLLFTLGRLVSYSHAPEQISARVMLTHMQIGMGGVIYVDDGWQSIIDQLYNQAVTNNVQIQTSVNVNQLTVLDNGEWQVAVHNHEPILCQNIIYTGPPQALSGLLGESSQLPFNNFEPIKAAALDVALTKLPNPENLFAMGIDAPYYYSVHSNYARLSQKGESTILHVLKYHHPDESIDVSEEKRKLEDFLEELQPGWQKYIITKRCLPQITVNARLPKAEDASLFSRGCAILPGLYAAGDWASPSFILSEAAAESGKQAALEVIDKEMRIKHAN
ncbi:FAD-dependent oxidoreductase [Bacillus infantis]|uniref:phytoene desaturase family protein n=1 Tax=Bacillus infantis TaxID=324767 RepID=UPI000B9BEE37|nr:FAD-dependent oxidoreductase [Bacillus infantis]MCK6208887.1 FAD-dependent oxidoreductase [Bacillus infantis]OXT16599.1 FAD-dependent pyridine nucleotide-disulfide oxidoreductase [Bacillus sp. OG2]